MRGSFSFYSLFLVFGNDVRSMYWFFLEPEICKEFISSSAESICDANVLNYSTSNIITSSFRIQHSTVYPL